MVKMMVAPKIFYRALFGLVARLCIRLPGSRTKEQGEGVRATGPTGQPVSPDQTGPEAKG